MPTHTRLLFGFPVLTQHPFTTVVDGSVHHGMVQDWYDVVAAAHGLPLVPQPTSEQLYGPGEDDTVGEAERERLQMDSQQYFQQVGALIDEMGCSLEAVGSQDFQPDYFVQALCPRPESEPQHSPFMPLPDLTVGPEVLERLRRFCQVLGIPYREPRWYLVDSYHMD